MRETAESAPVLAHRPDCYPVDLRHGMVAPDVALRTTRGALTTADEVGYNLGRRMTSAVATNKTEGERTV